jgi:hypothetical protein
MFAEPSAMGLRSGDDFAVPLCALHHRALHACGDELTWWATQGVDPMSWLEMFHLNTFPDLKTEDFRPLEGDVPPRP